MESNYTKSNNIFLLFLFLLFFVGVNSQSKQWDLVSEKENNFSEKELKFRKNSPSEFKVYSLNYNNFKNSVTSTGNKIIEMPTEFGLQKFSIKEASSLAPELSAKFPMIKSYVGQGIDNPSQVARFSLGTDGLHAVIFSAGKKTFYIDPYTNDKNNYIAYNRNSLSKIQSDFECLVKDEVNSSDLDKTFSLRNSDDDRLRIFRLAIVCSGEYAQFHLDNQGVSSTATDEVKKAAVLSAMNTSMTRINGVYERDLGVKMEIVANNDLVIFLDAATDNITDGSAGTMINQVQSICDSVIGNANYDIGHIFSIGGSGLAGLGVVCITGQKGRGVTGIATPMGDPYDIDYVAHEMGHQFGANHTQNNSCNRNSSTAVEPGSASTIMGYAGICAPNVQNNSDDHFHSVSIDEMWATIQSSATCGVVNDIGNTTPTSDAGIDRIVPKSTPFVLTGTGTDVDTGNVLTYNWEQTDNEVATMPPLSTNTEGPAFRSFPSSTSPNRYMPALSVLALGNSSSTWEVVPSVARELNFSLVVRDNNAGGGNSARDDMKVTIDDVSGPFIVTSQTGLTSWTQSTTETITWDVAGTDVGAVNTPNVDILLSTDGGMTYPTVLATSVPNDGSHDITVPNVSEENCRVMVKGTDNIFFNVNTAQIGIGYSIVATEVCETYDFTVNQTLTPNAAVFQTIGSGNIPDSGIISDLNFKYDITSPNLGQLHLRLVGPSGAVSYPINGGCSGNADMQVLWDDEAASGIVCATPAIDSATPRSGQPLTVFDGSEMNGNWLFSVANVGSTTMVFNTASIEVCKNVIVATVLSVEKSDFDVFNIYPNPSNGTINISLSSSDDVKISLFDIRGRLISSQSHVNNSGTFNKELNFNTVSSGVYMLNVKSGDKTATKKLIIK